MHPDRSSLVAASRSRFGRNRAGRLALAAAIAAAMSSSALLVPPPASAAACTPLTNNVVVTASTTFCPGTYTLADSDENGVVIVRPTDPTKTTVIDGTGVTLQGKGYKGYGIYLNGQSNVVIKNFTIAGYYYGMRLENATGLVVQGNKAWNNYTNKGRFLNINAPVSSPYGGGILLNNVSGSTIGQSADDPRSPDALTEQSNVLTGQSSGLDLYASSNNVIRGNDASNNSAWGIKLHGSDGNTIARNRAHHVNRTGDRGFDSAGVLMTQGSDGNTVERNDLTYSGDGFFIGNQHSTPSNNNTISYNNGSFSPHNCFEATFGTNNRFYGNTAESCNYGFWLGYSKQSYLEGNTVQKNRTDGINIDRGGSATLTGNTIVGNGRHGVALTELSSGMATPPRSTGHAIRNNTIRDNASAGVYLQDTTNSGLEGNRITGNANGLYLTGGSTGTVAQSNDLVCASGAKTCQYNAYDNMASGTTVDAGENWWGTADAQVIAGRIFDALDDPTKGRVIIDNPRAGSIATAP